MLAEVRRVDARGVDLGDAGVVETTEHLGFLLQSARGVWIRLERQQHLEGDASARPVLFGEVDRTHAAVPDPLQDAELVDAARQQGMGRAAAASGSRAGTEVPEDRQWRVEVIEQFLHPTRQFVVSLTLSVEGGRQLLGGQRHDSREQVADRIDSLGPSITAGHRNGEPSGQDSSW